jgi:hypothetical protein
VLPLFLARESTNLYYKSQYKIKHMDPSQTGKPQAPEENKEDKTSTAQTQEGEEKQDEGNYLSAPSP